MKKTLLILSALFISIVLHSQNENPFAKFGYDVLVATSSKGEFTEFHDQTDIVEIGSILFNRHTNEIVKVLDKDETTIDISSATTAMSIDPLCEKYYWISPYVYCANNPIKWVDLKGDSLTLAGQQSDLQATANVHNNKLQGYYNVAVDANGLVSMTAVAGADMSTMTQSQINYANVLDKVVNGTNGINRMTTINVVNNSENVLIGLASSATIDIGDIQAVGNGNVGSATTLMHETWEQYKMQVGKSSVTSAHNQAIGVENTISGQQSQGATIQYDYQNPRTGTTSPTGTITIPFINNATTIIRFRNNNILTPIMR